MSSVKFQLYCSGLNVLTSQCMTLQTSLVQPRLLHPLQNLHLHCLHGRCWGGQDHHNLPGGVWGHDSSYHWAVPQLLCHGALAGRMQVLQWQGLHHWWATLGQEFTGSRVLDSKVHGLMGTTLSLCCLRHAVEKQPKTANFELTTNALYLALIVNYVMSILRNDHKVDG